jgi:hypothetical protein
MDAMSEGRPRKRHGDFFREANLPTVPAATRTARAGVVTTFWRASSIGGLFPGRHDIERVEHSIPPLQTKPQL